jgi:serine/threonine protein kinase/Flp pilus assembly protein TadD
VATPERWQKIKEILGSALDREPSERRAFLEEACAHEDGLRAEVESLLAAHADAEGLSEHPWTPTPLENMPAANTIGPYRLRRELGVGGMGQVWLAEQTEPVRRIVAVKLIKPGMFDAAVVQRFQSERQSLAIMDHPAIAKVLDAGATPAGQPYLVMEYVDGPPITDYCDGKKLEIHDRLKLFLQVCEGVQHAHQKAIIHRDLKPSNILVVEVDGKPMPRIIDFGLAKATAPMVPGETRFTQPGAFMGTPGHMSPEQADPNVQDVDTRTDVYSLGVVLYELLTGFLPFDMTHWKKQRLDEVLRQLRETDPQRPSTRVSTNRDTSMGNAAARGIQPAELVSLLRGDLDWITLKALEKDRERRYGAPSELAADIEHYLENRPVVARPASKAYRLRKYVRRNRVAVAVAGAACGVLVAFAAMQAVQLRRTTRERDRADRITAFMTKMFEVSDPSAARGNSITAREILDRASKDIDTGLANDSELRSQLMGTMGKVYVDLGLFPQAQSMLERAVGTARLSGETRQPLILSEMSTLSYLLVRQGKFAEAESLARKTLASQRRTLGARHEDTLVTMRFLAFALESQGKYQDAEKVQREALEKYQESGRESTDSLKSLNQLGNILDEAGRVSEAEHLYRKAFEGAQRLLGPEHPTTLIAASNLGGTLREENRLAEAESIQLQTLETRRRVLGANHPDTLAAQHNLANTLGDLGRTEEAEKLLVQTLEAQRHVLGEENPETLLTMENLGGILHERGRNPEAETILREALEYERRLNGIDQALAFPTADFLGATLSAEGKFREAKKLYLDRLEVASRNQGAEAVASAWYVYAKGASQAGRREEAFDHLREAISHGYSNVAEMRSESDLKPLHSDPRFENLMIEAQKRGASSAQKNN